jgi:hypothetical protein
VERTGKGGACLLLLAKVGFPKMDYTQCCTRANGGLTFGNEPARRQGRAEIIELLSTTTGDWLECFLRHRHDFKFRRAICARSNEPNLLMPIRDLETQIIRKSRACKAKSRISTGIYGIAVKVHDFDMLHVLRSSA